MRHGWVLILAVPVGLASGACRKAPEAARPAEVPTAAPTLVTIHEPTDAELEADEVRIDGQVVKSRHSVFDMGRISSVFDGDWNNLARTTPTKTAVIELVFPAPRRLKAMRMKTAAMDVGLTVRLFGPNQTEPRVYTKQLTHVTTEPTVDLEFKDFSGPVEKVRIELKDLAGGDGHIHIREIQFKG